MRNLRASIIGLAIAVLVLLAGAGIGALAWIGSTVGWR